MRNAPHVWKSFWSLKTGEWFSIGKTTYIKLSMIHAEDLRVVPRKKLLAPWRRVRTKQLVKGSKFHPIPGTMTGRRVNNDGMTHFVGDDCPGGYRITATQCEQAMQAAPDPMAPLNQEWTGILEKAGGILGEASHAKNEAEMGTPNPTGEPIRGTELNDAR